MSQHTSKTLIQYYNSPYPLTCLNMMKSFSVVLGINLIQVLLWKSAIASNTICLSSIPYKSRLKIMNIINRNNLHLTKPNAQIFRCCYFLCRFYEFVICEFILFCTFLLFISYHISHHYKVTY